MFDPHFYKNPPIRNRSIPLWSWNDQLDAEEIRRQVRQMNAAGIGGFVMHARSGLRTPYMGEAWMEAVRAAVEEASANGMEAWCYDENGWPSGTANGVVPSLGRNYQQQWLSFRWLERGGESGELEKSRICIADVVADMADNALLLAELAWSGENWEFADSNNRQRPLLGIYTHVNPFYVDILHPKVIEAFLQACHVRYEEQFGQEFGITLKGIFTDEFKIKSVPWSEIFRETYLQHHGRELLLDLPLVLGCAVAEAKPSDSSVYAARYRFWRMVSELFEQSVATVGNWCRVRGWQLTGHIMGEDDLLSQMNFSGGVMPLYAHMDMPGIDFLGREQHSVLLPKQVSSVARQLDKRFVLTETFGCGGWNLTFEHMKQIGEWQFVLGVNRLCPHLQGYSLKGSRKRDYPPSIYVQQPWWDDYHNFETYFARLSYLLSLGEADCGLFILHPIQSAWLLYDPGDDTPVRKQSVQLNRLSERLLGAQCDFDFGDETILASHGGVSGNRMTVGRASYHTVILPDLIGLSDLTFRLLQDYCAGGGRIIVYGRAPSYRSGEFDGTMADFFADPHIVHYACEDETELDSLVKAAKSSLENAWSNHFHAIGENTELYLHRRTWEGAELYYYVNTSSQKAQRLELRFGIDVPGRDEMLELDALRGTVIPWTPATGQQIVIEPGQSRLFLLLTSRQASADRPPTTVSPTSSPPSEAVATTAFTLALDDRPWQGALLEANVLTLDYAKHRSGDAPWSAPTYVLKIQELYLSRKEPVPIELWYEFEVSGDALNVHPADGQELPGWRLAMEDRENWTVFLNDLPLPAEALGTYRDHAIRTYDIQGLVRQGRNSVRMSRLFVCSVEVYRFYDNNEANLAPIRNKLTYDTEVESIYILGPFAVQQTTSMSHEGDALTTQGPFLLAAPRQTIDPGNATASGCLFYAGTWRMKREIRLPNEVLLAVADRENRLLLRWDRMTAPLCRISVNGTPAKLFIWGPYVYDLTDFTRPKEGLLSIEMDIVTSNRNLFGPHHHLRGEVTFVGPTSFTDRIGWVDAGSSAIWTDRYSFMKYGLLNLRIEIVHQGG